MDLLAYWKWKNYVKDLEEGAGFNFNSDQSRFHSEISIGEALWLVTGIRVRNGMKYVLIGKLQVSAKTYNDPGYKYGKYRVWGSPNASTYYDANGPDLANLLLRLSFQPKHPISDPERIAQSLQTVRGLTSADSSLLEDWTHELGIEPRAYQIADEENLERAIETSEDAVFKIIDQHDLGISEQRRQYLRTSYHRNRASVRRLHDLYRGRCQLCGFDSALLYGARVCNGHHIVYLSRGGTDEISNLLLICPNHHAVIHATDAVFDFRDLHYVFANGRREPLVLNQHLLRTEP